MIDRLIPFVLNPARLVLGAWRACPIGSFQLRLDYDVFPRPHYTYCIYQAAQLAERLGIDRISVIEFGVAGGNGLVEMERIATEVESHVKTRIDIWGFDTGAGLPEPIDYRDIPYIWQEGFFKMDVPALKARLGRSRLVLGEIKDTLPRFIEQRPAPIAAIVFDLDYYSSTRDAFEIFQAPTASMLPRVFCYMDDVASTDVGILCDHVGQLLAIREYNENQPMKQIAPIAGLGHSRRVQAKWNDQIYVHHHFDHPQYSQFVHPGKVRELPLANSRA